MLRTTAVSPRRAIRPAYEGIETEPLEDVHKRRPIEVARSAPLMRGLKRWIRRSEASINENRSCRAIRPAYEGI